MNQEIKHKRLKAFLTIVFAAMAAYIIYALYRIWPADFSQTKPFRDCLWPFGMITYSHEHLYFLLVSLGGALGAVIHVLISFSAYVGNNEFKVSWLSWYFLRPFVGSSLALIFYFLLRGGILSYSAASPSSQRDVNTSDSSAKRDTSIVADTAAIRKQATDSADKAFKKSRVMRDKADSAKVKDSLYTVFYNKLAPPVTKPSGAAPAEPEPVSTPIPLNPFGIMAIACLAGLFSKEATQKLEEVFQSIFNVKNAPELKDKLKSNGANTTNTSTDANPDQRVEQEIDDVLPDADADNEVANADEEPQG